MIVIIGFVKPVSLLSTIYLLFVEDGKSPNIQVQNNFSLIKIAFYFVKAFNMSYYLQSG